VDTAGLHPRRIPSGEPGTPAEHLGTLAETIGTLLRTRANMEMMIADRDRIAAKVAALEEQIRDASAAHTRGREDVAAIEAERNRLTGEVDQARAAAADAERLRADLAARDQFLAERAERSRGSADRSPIWTRRWSRSPCRRRRAPAGSRRQ